MADDNTNILVAKIFGAVLLLVGLLGFLVGTGTLIVFGVNPLHSVVHLGSGLLLLVAAYAAEGANAGMANLGLGVVYVLVAVLGFAGILVPELLNTSADAFANADNILHSLIAIVLVAAGAKAFSESDSGTAAR
jgi:hypothetical protein